MVTTIQIPIELKNELDSLKSNPKMSYASLLSELVKNEKRRKRDFLLREYAQKYNEVSLAESKEWESADLDWD